MHETLTVIETYLHQIIDDIHPLFKPISDEEMLKDQDDHGVFTRDFIHQSGKIFRMQWKVYYGTPDTVRTVFEPAVTL